ncbi:sodium-dependent transporter [Halobaculum sp. MBLA0143]|uniref:sodium-dependent transporter n=1 Tax=Halobaculum sp. MBLA0143 TaxID=3079933 RepID=UPI003524858D
MSSDRASWASRLGFVFAAVGSAVGLGNIWQFPFQTGQNGGAAFIVVYLAVVVGIGFPAMLAEFVLGRAGQANSVDAFERVAGGGRWRIAGAVAAVGAFWILSFYSVVGGWVIRYTVGSLRGVYFDAPASFFADVVSTGPDAVAFHVLFMAIVVVVVAAGVEGGIERSTKVMVPTIVLLLGGLAAWATTLDGVTAAYSYYLSPDLTTVRTNLATILPSAVGQAFFTLSLGMGAMLTYASYLGDDDSLPVDGGVIVVLNTLVGLLAGLVIFPVLFSLGIEPGGGGAGTAFVTLGGAFARLPAGRLLGTVFFFVLLLAAVSSAISLLEVVVSVGVENTTADRPTVAVAVGAGCAILGVPSAFGYLGWFNAVAYNLLLPVAVLLLVVYVGWVFGDGAARELRRGTRLPAAVATAWLWFVRVVVPAGIGLTLVLGLQSLALRAGLLSEAIVLG